MTSKQEEVLAFIRGYLARNGVPPTMSEIAVGIGLHAGRRSTVHSHLQALVRDGHVEKRTLRGTTAYYPTNSTSAAA